MVLERQTSKPEIAAQKRSIKLPPAIGDWTTYKPPKILVKKVKSGLYGFDRLSKEELNLVLHIHYRFIQQLLKHLKIDLGMAVELFTVQVEQTTYLNFLRTLSGPVVQSKIIIPGLHDAVSLFLALPLADSIINFALGSQNLEPINRGLTEAENTAFAATISEYLPEYAAAFENIIEKPTFSMVSSPDVTIDPSINTSSTFVCFSAEASAGESPAGKIFFGYLGSTLKTLLANYMRKDEQKLLDFSSLPASFLSKITVPLSVTLGNTTLTTSEINRLETGDVVTLNTPINAAVPITIGKALKLLCQPGSKDKKGAARVNIFIEADKAKVPPPSLTSAGEKEVPAQVKKEEKLPEEKNLKEEEEEEEEEDFLEDEDLLDDFSDEDFPEDEI